MFEGPIPELPNILIEKEGNLSGRFTVRDLPKERLKNLSLFG